MEYYVITQSGRQVIPLLRERGKDDEADVLDFLRVNGASTVQRISDDLPLPNETLVRFILSNSVREKWVKRRRTKTSMYM